MTRKKRHKKSRTTNRQARITHQKKLNRKVGLERQRLKWTSRRHHRRRENLPPEEKLDYGDAD